MQRVVLFANSTVAIPAAQILMSRGQCAGVVLPHYEHEGNAVLSQLCQQFGIPLLVSESAGFDERLTQFLREMKPDIGIVLTFPFKISKTCLSIPEKGIYNFHFALLPNYRGADPIFWQIKNAEKFGGISVHRMTNKLDEGSLLLVEKLEIEAEDTYGTHWQKLQLLLANKVFNEFLDIIGTNTFESRLRKQNNEHARYWDKPVLNDMKIDWGKMAAEEIQSLVNASNPNFQGALTFLGRMEVRLLEVEVIEYKMSSAKTVGSILELNETILIKSNGSKHLKLNIVMTEQGVMSGLKFYQYTKKFKAGDMTFSS